MKKSILIFITVLILLSICLSLLASNPIISCNTAVSEQDLEAIKGQSKGVYSSRLPLVPVYVSVDGISQGTVFYTIHYFPFGTVGMSYTEGDGYNIEKPLTGA